MSEPIYLDHNGTTPVDPDVLEAMLPFFIEQFGNASSATPLGRIAKDAIETARAQVADLIGAAPEEIIFTSGGTEASNHAIFGFARMAPETRRRIVTSTVEHPATEKPCQLLSAEGFDVRRIRVTRDGVLDIEEAIAAIDERTALVTIIHAQNETGVLQTVADLANAAKRHGVPVHADAAQSLGKVPVDVERWGIDALTIAGHKLYAPKGIGALYLRARHELPSIVAGAGQERGRRPGTENVPYIVGLGMACQIARSRLAEDARRIASLRDRLWERLSGLVPGLIRIGGSAQTLPNTLNVLFPAVAGNDVLATTPSVAASTGSACHAGESRPSTIILALGYPEDVAIGAVRLTLGRRTTDGEVDRAANDLAAAWLRLSER